MPARRPNILFLFSDEHDPRHMGVSGSPLAHTPNMDALAARGTRFVNAYTPSPICVPARASLATGLEVHDIRCWDNALAYDGGVRGWGHVMRAHGHRVESIGKLHYTNGADDTGFAAQHLAMHIWEGIGQVWGSVRDPLPDEPRGRVMLKQIGPGWSNYNQFDTDVAEAAAAWLRERAAAPDAKPWCLFVGLVAPHFPLVAPQSCFDRYPLDALEPSKLLPSDGHAHHPWIARREAYVGEEAQFDGLPDRRRLAIAGYLALTTFVDAKIGEILAALGQTGLDRETVVIYSSDHGDNLGARGLWGKSNLYRESVGVPLIMAGPGIPAGRIAWTPASLVDLHATFLDTFGLPDVDDGRPRGSSSLLDMLAACDHGRTVMSQYHAVGAPTGAFMVADARYKYHWYVDFPPELFDLRFDPEETCNRAGIRPAGRSATACTRRCSGTWEGGRPSRSTGWPGTTRTRWWSGTAAGPPRCWPEHRPPRRYRGRGTSRPGGARGRESRAVTAHTGPGASPWPTFRGRRRGRRLRSGRERLLEERLPACGIRLDGLAGRVDPALLFAAPPREVWLEIGFGAGEHLAWQAARAPDVGFIGCEPWMNGVAALLHRLEQGPHAPVRILADDARPLLPLLRGGSIARIFVLFPDPWPKRRHAARRIVQHQAVAEFARLLRPGGELRLATDDAGCLRWMLEHMSASPDFDWLARRAGDWRRRPDDWPGTRYEAKARAAGRLPVFLRYRRRE